MLKLTNFWTLSTLAVVFTSILLVSCKTDKPKQPTSALLDSASIAAVARITVPLTAQEDVNPIYNAVPTSLNILLVGNSYLAYNPVVNNTRTNLGVHHQIRKLVSLSGVEVNTELVSIGGGTLKQHWENGETPGSARERILSGEFDLLIIQGRYDIHRDYKNRERFEAYAEKFAELATHNQMKTVFFGLWSTDKQISPEVDHFGPVADSIYRSAAIRNKVAYSPTGVAYTQMYKLLSEQLSEKQIEDSMTADKIHPTTALAYLAASTVYVTLFGNTLPSLASFQPTEVSTPIGEIAQAVAQLAVSSN